MSAGASQTTTFEPLQDRTISEVTDLVQDALVQLNATIVAASAIVELSQSQNSLMTPKTILQRYNALEFLLQHAASAEDKVWAAIDCDIVDADE